MARLASYVHVLDDQGRNHVFGPSDDVPEWAAQRITNPAAWSEPPEPVPAKKPPTKRAPRRKAPDG